ncbi:MAG TPA: nitroreductase family deazaflavin-dependent oxidoreductase [Terriglobales bacterium]|nr:nitroreductase family deazaflavin-dependent oxidoreductase [Terriglobales bacterium]
MPLPRWLARLNLRVTNRILGPLAEHAPGMGIVIHQGRKTNRRYRTPVMVFRHGDSFVIALTYGSESQWVQNVLAHGGCDFETRGHTFRLIEPRRIHDDRRSLMPGMVRLVLGVMNVSDFLEPAIQN